MQNIVKNNTIILLHDMLKYNYIVWVAPTEYKTPHETEVTFLKMSHISVHNINHLYKTLLKMCFSIH